MNQTFTVLLILQVKENDYCHVKELFKDDSNDIILMMMMITIHSDCHILLR